MAGVEKRRVTFSVEQPLLESKAAIKNKKEDLLDLSYGPLILLFAGRLCSVLWSNISDCDETYNYWEPTHYLIYGYGFQTWEYSPIYAIRSYGYIWIHALIGYICHLFLNSDKVLAFYMTRCCLGLISAISEYYFYRGVCYQFGLALGRLVLLFLLSGAGLFISSAAYLPSSFSMYMTMISYGALFSQQIKVSIVATAASTLIAWPFSAVLGIPIAYDVLLRRRKIMLFIKLSIISLIVFMGSIIIIDSYYYGRLVFSPLNIVLYNVFSENRSHLYGVEPWTYYFINGFLNFNIIFCVALLSGPIILCYWAKARLTEKRGYSKFWNPIVGMYLWIIIFFTQAHKEERFLFPIYPLICINGALGLHFIQKAITSMFPKKIFFLNSQKFTSLTVMIYVLLSISRILALYKGYSAPTEIFIQLRSSSALRFEQTERHSVCVGKEWYRFPSNFFLPDNFRMYFIRSDFHGQLPKPFSSLPNATQIIPSGMNDRNSEEGNQYTDVRSCEFLIDSDFPTDSFLEPSYSKQVEKWKIIVSVPFLDAKRSPRLLRAFYIPFLSENHCRYVNYNVLKRI